MRHIHRAHAPIARLSARLPALLRLLSGLLPSFSFTPPPPRPLNAGQQGDESPRTLRPCRRRRRAIIILRIRIRIRIHLRIRIRQRE